MTVVVVTQTEEEVLKEEKAMRSAAKKILSSKASAKAYLRKNGYITAKGRLTKRYGG